MATKLNLLLGGVIRALEEDRAKIDEKIKVLRGMVDFAPLPEHAKLAKMDDKRRSELSRAMKASWKRRREAAKSRETGKASK